MKESETFEDLGKSFQYRLLNQILSDRKFAVSILDILKPSYFENFHLRKITQVIKDVYEQSNSIPDAEGIQMRVNDEVKEEHQRKFFSSTLENILESNTEDYDFIQRRAMEFCTRQELLSKLADCKKIAATGDVESFSECVDLVQEAINSGKEEDNAIDVFDGIDEALSEDYRDPIPTGIDKLDEVMNGGLAKTELGVVLAALGVGKTTMMTKIANSAKNMGYNVLQIFFEDQKKDIQRKHISAWSGIELNDLNEFKDEVKPIVKQKESVGGTIKLKKFNSSGVTIPQIKNYIRKLISQGFIPDVVVLDYIDCVNSTGDFSSDDIYQSEGSVMRQFETMLSEFNIAGWTATQGNRSSIGSDIVEAYQTGGSIQKAQIGHFIMSIAKGLEQKEHGRANLAILKSRIGRDGLTFNDAIFDNSRVHIEIPSDKTSKTFLEAKKIQQMEGREKIRETFQENNNNGQ